MIMSDMQGDAVDLEGLMGLFFRGRYRTIAIMSLQTLQQKRMTTKELAEVIGESRTSVSDVVKRMERLGIVQREWRYSPWSVSSQLGRRFNRCYNFWKRFHSESI